MTRTNRFGGGHVVLIAVAVCVAVVAAPIGVLAGTGSSVSITDAHHKHIVKVSKSGALSVSLGSNPIPVKLAGKPLAVSGSVTSKVSGTVSVNGLVSPAIPATPLYAEGSVPGNSGSDGFVWQGSKATRIAITSIILSASGSTDGDASGYLAFYSQTTPNISCSDVSGHGFGIGERLPLSVPVGQTTEVTFPTPMVWGGDLDVGGSNCITMEAGGPAADEITYAVNGFLD
jgi:hypothetical protein